MKGLFEKVWRFVKRPMVPFSITAIIVIGVLITVGTGYFLTEGGRLNYTDIPVAEAELVIAAEQEPEATEASLSPPRNQGPAVPGAPPIEVRPELVETTSNGPMPIKASDGSGSIDVYRRSLHTSPETKRAILLLTELGMQYEISEKSVLLPAEIGLVYSAYAPETENWMIHGRSHGHEVLLELPLKSASAYVDRGPLQLKPQLSPDELIQRLRRVLAASTGYVAVVVEASGFANFPDQRAIIAQELESRGIGLVEIEGRHFMEQANDTGLAYVSIERGVDSVLDPDAIKDSLTALTRTAMENGIAFGFVRPYPVSLDLVWQWSQNIDAQGVSLESVANAIKPN